jgi:uncharacterized membrane protein
MKIVLYSIQLIKLEVELWEARVKAHKIEIHMAVERCTIYVNNK